MMNIKGIAELSNDDLRALRKVAEREYQRRFHALRMRTEQDRLARQLGHVRTWDEFKTLVGPAGANALWDVHKGPKWDDLLA